MTKEQWTKEEIIELKKWGFKPENHPPFLNIERLLLDRPWLLDHRVCDHAFSRMR